MTISNLKIYSVAFLVGSIGSLVMQFSFSPYLARAASNQITADFFSVVGFDGRQRLQLATYDGSYSKAEKGQPLIGFSDNKGKLRLLLRLAGANESPAIVLKDTNGKDRLVMGLALNDAGEEPYIYFYDQQGKRKNVVWNLMK